MYKILTAAALALLAGAPAMAQKQTPPAPGTPRDFRIPETRNFALPNGMRVTLVPYGTLPKSTVQLVVRTGNVNEGANQIWLADLTGDLMQEGTTSRTGEQVAREAAGMGGALNIGVGIDETAVGGDVLGEFTPQMVALIADVVKNPRLPESELTRLKANRIRSVAQAKAQPGALAQERFRALLYPNHPYGRLYPTEAMLTGYTPEQIRTFYDANVGAARSHLYIAGRFDAAATEAAIRQAFGDWKRGAEPVLNVPQPTSKRAVHLIDRPGAVQSTLLLGLPVVNPSHQDYPALQVTNALLGGSFGSRITRNIRENKGYTYSPRSSVSTRYRDAYWAQSADVATDVTGASLKEIFFEIDRLRNEAPPAEELRGIQNYLAGNFVLQNSTTQGIIGQLRFLNLHGLGQEYLQNYVRRVYAVTSQDVQRIARSYVRPDQMTIVVVGDRRKIASQVAPYGPVMQ
ncbi:pitrilysin family protein [soil metagenome]